MKIVVCMKQVPATSKVDIDPETGAMKRMSGETRTNPYDLFALETALAIREKTGGTVTVLTMGPSQAEEMIRDAYTMGADEGVILSDRKFAGADVLATSYALAQGIQVIGGADLIICGRQTTDGDTAQRDISNPCRSSVSPLPPPLLLSVQPLCKKYLSRIH